MVAANELYGKYPHKLILGNSTDTLMSILRYSHMLETLPAGKRNKMVNVHYHIKPRIASDSNVCFLSVIRDSARILPMMGHSLWRDYAEGVHHTFARKGFAVLGLLDCRILPPLEHLLYPEQYTYFRKNGRISTLEGFARIISAEKRTESAANAFRFFLWIAKRQQSDAADRQISVAYD